MATPIPLHQPTQYPSTLALAAIPSFHRLVHHMCVHHTLSHRPLLTFMGMHTHTSTFCRLSSTLHLPNAYGCQSTTLHIGLCTFPMHLRCISEALLCTLMHCILDSACYATLHCPLHLCLHTCCLRLFVCLFTFVTSACVACFVCLFPLLDWFH